jgi:hypothetical protein
MPYGEYRTAGHSFALRYAVPSIPGKLITRNEIDAAHKAHVDVGLVYETTGDTWIDGAAQGTRDGETGRITLQSLGAPDTVAMYHAVDSPVAPSQMSMCMAWLGAVIQAQKPYRTGVYGQYSVVEAAYARYPQAFRWQTPAWSQHMTSKHTDILQLGTSSVAGIQIDIDLAYSDHFGQWYADPSKQPHNPSEEAMQPSLIPPVSTITYTMPAGQYSKVTLGCDIGMIGNHPQKVRIAALSVQHGYSQITETEISTDTPVVVEFVERDVHMLSFHRDVDGGSGIIGFVVE